ncbi:MAG: glycosyltransferase family 2 protein [Thermoplasmataceae archaeon]
MVPCRNVDFTLRENLNSLKTQKGVKYDVIAIVDSKDDPSVQIINEIGIKYITTDYDCKGCSGKVKALSTALSRFKNYSVYVIADSDILSKNDWLEKLTSPFSTADVGLSTTFPYFKAMGGFWSKVKTLWGFVGQGMMESDLTRFGWGGSLAFRKELINEDTMKYFSSRVSDDTALTKICKEEGYKIVYVSEAQPIINSPDDFATFNEWSIRQTALSISSDKKILYLGIIAYFSQIWVFVMSFALIPLIGPIALIFLVPTLLGEIKMNGRLKEREYIYYAIFLILPFIYLYNLLMASRKIEISWRGNSYTLIKE